MKRKDDSSKHARFRSNRMFEQEGQWFFRTREEDDQGPFDDELEASTQLEVYLRMLESGLLPEAHALSPEWITKSHAR
jgi:hypothetical protein